MFGGSGNDIDITQGAEPGLITLKPNEPGTLNRVTLAMSAAIETINRRINNLGTAEATVVRQGRDRILIQYPGLQDTKMLKDLIGQTAKLTFHSVHSQTSAEEAKASRVPNGYKIYEGDKRGETGSYLLQEVPVVTGEDLVDAQPGFDQRTNEAIISFRFNQAGARKFGKFTTDHVGAPFAILLDDKVLSAPVIREPILGGSGQISGSFTVESANNLAIQLRSGALPAKLTIVEERTVGPSLGADSIEAGSRAGIIGARGDDHHDHRRLRHVRRLCVDRADRQRLHDRRADDGDRLDADAARHRRPRADHRHGGRRQRADLRAHPRRVARRQERRLRPSTPVSSAPSSPSPTVS